MLVHGCFGSSGEFRGLAQILAFHGQQSACFTYDDRAALARTSTLLRRALDALAEQTRVAEITVIGHSQGALIARKSLTESLGTPPPRRAADLRLVTISGPFDGIASAKTCGKAWLRPLTLGLLPASCYLKLIAILQEQGVLRPTPPDRLSDLGRLLARVYRGDGLSTRTP